MDSRDFPGCCTAEVLFDFGGTVLSSGQKRARGKQVMRAYIKKRIKYSAGKRCLIAITNDSQTAANSVLREMGFSHSPWMKKLQHPESKIRLWYLTPLDKRGQKRG